jgi:hypothetical protein
MGKSAGQVPDYTGAAQQQADASRAAVDRQTQQNRPGISTPFMQQTWTVGPDGTPQLSTGFAGGLGAGVSAATDQAGQALSRGLDPSLFSPVMSGNAARDQAIQGAFDQSMSRLNPMLEQRETQLRARLANQGLSPNSQAYRTASGAFGRDRNDAIQSALASAIGQGTAAGESALRGNIAGSQANIANALTQRNAPIQSLGALQGLMSTPQFAQAGAADPGQFLNALMAQGNFNLQNAQQQGQAWGSGLSGLLSGLGGFAMLSDERLKTNIVRDSVEALPGVRFATWEWKGTPGRRYLGVIAQDVEKVRPDLVYVGPDGFRRVDYSFLWGDA